MADIVESKTTRIGNSLWLLIPKEVAKEKKIEAGQRIKIAILDKERDRTISETFGMFKGAKGFKRVDHLERKL